HGEATRFQHPLERAQHQLVVVDDTYARFNALHFHSGSQSPAARLHPNDCRRKTACKPDEAVNPYFLSCSALSRRHLPSTLQLLSAVSALRPCAWLRIRTSL